MRSSRGRLILAGALLASLYGCGGTLPSVRAIPTGPQIDDAHFMECNEQLTKERGTHMVDATLGEAHAAMHRALLALAFSIESQAAAAGLIEAAAAAPAPLDEEEWAGARAADLSTLKEHITNDTDWPGWLVRYDVEGDLFVVKVKMVQARGGVTAARVTLRRRTAADPSREQYLPCATAAAIVEKVWAAFER